MMELQTDCRPEEYIRGRKHLLITCEICGEEFWRRETEVRRYPHNFCSRSCSARFKASLFPPGTSRSKKYDRARKIYVDRFGTPSCSHCGVVPSDVHHLNEDTTDNRLENLISLCRSCHVAYHNHKTPKRKKAINAIS
jgi:5-methylcytosine-specific restriction endonuclease McrA